MLDEINGMTQFRQKEIIQCNPYHITQKCTPPVNNFSTVSMPDLLDMSLDLTFASVPNENCTSNVGNGEFPKNNYYVQ